MVETARKRLSSRDRILLLGLALTLSTLVVYWQVQGHAFVTLDDYQYVVENPHVRHGLTPQGIVWAFTTGYASNWHPLTWLSHMLDCTLYGLNPKGHHLNSLLLHLANTLLLFWVLRRMTAALWRSAFVAALFALHPLHVESVAWVAERKDLLSTLFWMMTVGAYARYVERPGLGRYLLTLLLFAFGLMAKPMLVTLPFVLLLLDYWPLGRRHLAPLRLIREKLPFFALTTISSIITFSVQKSWGAVISTLPLKDRIANALVSYVTYIGKTMWPVNLACFYPHPLDTLPRWQVGGSLLLLVGISIFVIRAGRRCPYLPVGWFWYLGTLVPVIGLVQVGAQAMADRYTYIPLIGLFLITAWTAAEVGSKRSRLRMSLWVGMLLPFLAVGSWLQAQSWRTSVTLFEHALAVTRNNQIAHNNLGNILARQGRFKEASYHLSAAVRLNPNHATSQNNLGSLFMQQGRLQEAIAHLSKAVQIDPEMQEARFNLRIALQRMTQQRNERLSSPEP